MVAGALRQAPPTAATMRRPSSGSTRRLVPYLLGHGIDQGALDVLRASMIDRPEVSDVLVDGRRTSAPLRQRARPRRLRRVVDRRDDARSLLLQIVQAAEVTEQLLAPRSRSPSVAHLGHHRLRPRPLLTRPLRARPRFTGEAAHRAPLLDAVVAPCGTHAPRVRGRCGPSGRARGAPGRLQGEFLHARLMTPFFSTTTHRVGSAARAA